MASKRFSLADRLVNENQLENVPGSGIFSEEPVDLDTFIHDRAYLNQPELELGEHQFDLIRHMEQIYLPNMYPYMVREFGEQWEPVRYVNRLICQWGKGSGKDMSVQYAVARIAYLLLCLENPQKYFNLASQSDIHILNIAMNASQARRAFFRPMGKLLKHSRWFKDKVMNDITDAGTNIILEKQIELISGHSLAENFEGLSPIAVVLDEISGFQSEESKASKGITESNRTAEAVYDIVLSSASTRFPENYKLAAISYPRYLHDPIQNLCNVAREDIERVGEENSIYWVDGPRATWEVNPRYRNYEFISIPQTTIKIPKLKTFIENYELDAAEARAKYECRPERAVNRFMRNDSALAAAFPKQNDDWIEPLSIFYSWGVDEDGAKAEDSYELAAVPNWQVNYQFGPQLVPMEGAIYALHADLAVTGDRAGIAMCHVKNWERREHTRGDDPNNKEADYQEDYRPVVKVDFVTYYEADLQAVDSATEIMHPREIQLRWFRNLVRELRRRGFTIGLVTLDSYQSEDTIQILESWGIESDTQSMDRNAQPYINLREIIYDGRLEGYYHDILMTELESLNRLPNGKIDHPPNSSKDCSDAVCGAVLGAITLGGDEGQEPEEVDVHLSTGMSIHSPITEYSDYSLSLRPEDLRLSFQ